MFPETPSTTLSAAGIATYLGVLLAAAVGGVEGIANTTTTARLTRRCAWSPAGPLNPDPADWMCRTPLDQLAPASIQSWDPWTHDPECAPSSQTSKLDSLYCGFTKDDLRGDHGTIVLTTTKIAADGVRLLQDRSPQWSRVPPFEQLPAFPPYQMREVDGKGLGIFANESIPKGTVLMRDSPVLLKLIDRPSSLSKKDATLVMDRAFGNLPNQERKEVLDLARSMGGHPLDDVVRTNAFQVRFNGASHHGLFKQISRLNHACKPNAVTRWSQSRVQMEVLAYHDIEAGEEINISYAPLNILSQDRQDLIASSWGFECHCSLCADAGAVYVSDARRRQLDRVLEEMNLPEVRTPQLVTELVAEMEEVIVEEGLEAQRGDLYGIVSRIYGEMGDREGSLRYAEEGLGLQELYKGWDDHRTWRARRFVEYLKWKIGAEKEKRG